MILSRLFAAIALTTALAAPVMAADETNVSRGATLSGPGLAAHGYDVVAYFSDGKPTLGSDEFAIAHGGGTYRFATRANLEAFKTDPAKYEPAYGGFCAYGIALGKKFDGDPRYWRIVSGRLYLNLNKEIQAEWLKDVGGNLVKSEANWRRLISVAVGEL